MSRGWGVRNAICIALRDDASGAISSNRPDGRSTSWWRKATSMRSAKVAGLTRTAIVWRRLHRGLRCGTQRIDCHGKHAKLTMVGYPRRPLS